METRPAPQEPGSEPLLTSRNPATGEILARFKPDSGEGLERKLERALAAFRRHRAVGLESRARLLERVAEILEAEKGRLARLMTLEMGKPIRAAVQEAEKCAVCCRYYAENAARFLADEEVPAKSGRSFVRYQPLGPVLAIMPWNFPFWQVFRFAAPAVVAGNVGLLKHASNVPQCALALEEIFKRAGFAEGVFQTLLIGSGRVSSLIEDHRIKAVTLTGSVEAGRRVASAAGLAIKKTVLELGGSDPFIVMPSADLEKAVATAVQARTINNGQSCIAAKRFIVDRRIADEFESRLTASMAVLKVGDPLDEETDVGPLATREVLDSLTDQVNRTVALGARVTIGGKPLERAGYFFAPTVLTEVPAGSPGRQEELFGPVAAVIQVDGMEQAIRIANETPFGLGSCAWTNDPRERELFLEEVEAGLAFVNGMVASHPKLPFGGVKQSGYGRELGCQGLREFVNIKTVVVKETIEAGSATE